MWDYDMTEAGYSLCAVSSKNGTAHGEALPLAKRTVCYSVSLSILCAMLTIIFAWHSKHMDQSIRKEDTMKSLTATSQADPSVAKTYRVEDIAKILDIGRSSAYNLVREGHFKTVRIGTAIRISRKSFDEWLESQAI